MLGSKQFRAQAKGLTASREVGAERTTFSGARTRRLRKSDKCRNRRCINFGPAEPERSEATGIVGTCCVGGRGDSASLNSQHFRIRSQVLAHGLRVPGELERGASVRVSGRGLGGRGEGWGRGGEVTRRRPFRKSGPCLRVGSGAVGARARRGQRILNRWRFHSVFSWRGRWERGSRLGLLERF